jgi:hypothetical protein
MLAVLAVLVLTSQCSAGSEAAAGSNADTTAGRQLAATPAAAPVLQRSACTVVPGETTESCRSSCKVIQLA